MILAEINLDASVLYKALQCLLEGRSFAVPRGHGIPQLTALHIDVSKRSTQACMRQIPLPYLNSTISHWEEYGVTIRATGIVTHLLQKLSCLFKGPSTAF